MKNTLKRLWIVVFVLVLALAFILPVQAQAAGYWKQITTRFSAIAGETVATGDAVCISATDGKAYKGNAGTASLRPAVGVVAKGGAAAATIEVVAEGVLAGQTAATSGARLFLSATTAGALTTTAPTNPQMLGFVLTVPPTVASTSTVYYINVQAPLSAGTGY